MGFMGKVFGSKRRQFGEQALAMVRAQQRVAWAEFDATEFVIGYETRDRQRGRISLETVFERCQGVSDQEARRLLFEFMDLPSPEERGQGQAGRLSPTGCGR
ncbi:hypothetical protein IU429_29390 [Nocardia elegans]|nr:hypothetical protein [Nocardia elegans]MBF6451783.1 hypothetical protein [Nocardia elegans]